MEGKEHQYNKYKRIERQNSNQRQESLLMYKISPQQSKQQSNEKC